MSRWYRGLWRVIHAAAAVILKTRVDSLGTDNFLMKDSMPARQIVCVSKILRGFLWRAQKTLNKFQTVARELFWFSVWDYSVGITFEHWLIVEFLGRKRDRSCGRADWWRVNVSGWPRSRRPRSDAHRLDAGHLLFTAITRRDTPVIW